MTVEMYIYSVYKKGLHAKCVVCCCPFSNLVSEYNHVW